MTLGKNAQKPLLIPKLDFTKLSANVTTTQTTVQQTLITEENDENINTTNIDNTQLQGFHEEFMANLDSYSKSWREAALRE